MNYTPKPWRIRRLKTYIVPVVHVLEFGCEVRVQARNRPEASRLALKKDAEMASGDGYDWDRSELVRTRRGSWDKITEEKSNEHAD
jgi:hypothetical protein